MIEVKNATEMYVRIQGLSVSDTHPISFSRRERYGTGAMAGPNAIGKIFLPNSGSWMEGCGVSSLRKGEAT